MIYIGIDPDVSKSGFAVWNTETKKFEVVTAMPFFDLLDELITYSTNCHVILEAGWLNKKSNYHFSKSHAIGQRIAKNVGSNHQVGKLIEEYLKRLSMPYTLQQPKRSKTTADEFLSITGVKVKNQDTIDACMLVYAL